MGLAASRVRRGHPHRVSDRSGELPAQEGLKNKEGAAAWGYFAKGDELDAIAAGVREVAASKAGRFIMGPKVRARCRPVSMGAGRGIRNDTRAIPEGAPETPLSSLSAREIEILHPIGKGLSRAQVAAELSRSATTIDRHQESMTKKLGLSSRTDLVRFAIREGFAEA